MKSDLDFIVIGAQKSGTTSLFRYLRKHPEIFLPAAKEAPFFSESVYLEYGFDWFLSEFFGSADPNRLWGTITPSYMANLDAVERIHDQIPNVKLVAILRNPIDRAISHYSMTYKRGIEDRLLSIALEASLQHDHIKLARQIRNFTKETERLCYLSWSEYGRIIQHFLQYFPRDQIHILFYEDLAECPEYVLDSLLHFLALAPGFRPSNLGKRYFKGGTRTRFPWLNRVVEEVSLRLPPRYRSTLTLWHEVMNTAPDEVRDDRIPIELRRELQEFYRPDILLFEDICEIKTPWKEFY